MLPLVGLCVGFVLLISGPLAHVLAVPRGDTSSYADAARSLSSPQCSAPVSFARSPAHVQAYADSCAASCEQQLNQHFCLYEGAPGRTPSSADYVRCFTGRETANGHARPKMIVFGDSHGHKLLRHGACPAACGAYEIVGSVSECAVCSEEEVRHRESPTPQSPDYHLGLAHHAFPSLVAGGSRACDGRPRSDASSG